jgi:hypothetical protein
VVGVIKDKGPRCMLFKKDLKRAYRQIPVCPGDIHFIGFSWENCLFVDRVLPMGLRSSAQICKIVTLLMTPFSFSTKIEPRGIFQPPFLVLLLMSY